MLNNYVIFYSVYTRAILRKSTRGAALIIWASMGENLSRGFVNNTGAGSAPLLFAFWKVSYVNLLPVKFHFSR